MALFSKNVIKDNKGSVITVGEQNIISVSQQLAELHETSITSEGQNWKEIVEQLSLIQNTLHELPDEHENVRDQELVPSLSKAKAEAKKLVEKPEADKKAFVKNFNTFCDVSLKVAELAAKVAPFITVIGKLAGIPTL